MPRLTPAFIVSILAHCLLLGLALIVWPKDPPPEIVLGAVPVTVVSEVVREAAPAPTPAEEVTPEPPAESPVETPTPEPPAPQPTPTPPTPPRQPQRPPQRPPERPVQQPQRPPERPPERPVQQPQRPPAQPQRPPAQPQRPPATTEAPLDLDSIAGGGRPSDRTTPGSPPAGNTGAGSAPIATGPQVLAIAGQITDRWSFNCEIPGANSLTIRVRMSLSADGRITSGPTLVRPETSPVYRAVADAALRAARAAAPYQDLPDGFRGGELPILVFDTAGACRNR